MMLLGILLGAAPLKIVAPIVAPPAVSMLKDMARTTLSMLEVACACEE